MINQKSRSSVIAILIQILIWLVFGVAILFYQPLTGDVIVPYQLWIKQCIVLMMLAGAYYINSLILVPRYLLKNHTAYYFLLTIVLISGILLLNNYTDKWLNLPALMHIAFLHHKPSKEADHDHWFDIITLIISALVLGISTSITAIQKWQSDKQHNQKLQQEKTSSELSFLKAQINPHFFFNTLNNIYALTYVDAETSRKAIHQLSRMMRYLLYDTQQGNTMLSQEIDFIKDYICLMELRLTDLVQINFEYPVTLIDSPIAPMIFLPFVENAFKHGTSVDEPSEINIQIEQFAKQLKLNVCNSIISHANTTLDGYGGIGLDNTRRRLDLLFPNKYELLIYKSAETNEYNVNLILNLE